MRATEEQPGARPLWMRHIVTLLFLFAGGWLVLSPYLLDFAWHSAAWWNALVIGTALIGVAAVRILWPHRFHGLQWTTLVLGAWMIASPFVAQYAEVSPALWNALVVGALVVIGATASAAQPAPRPV